MKATLALHTFALLVSLLLPAHSVPSAAPRIARTCVSARLWGVGSGAPTIQLRGGEGEALDDALKARLETLVRQNPVMLFMKGSPDAPQCGFSSKVSRPRPRCARASARR
jgi:hypothetical protein